MKETFRRFATKYRYSLILLQQLVVTDFKLRYQGSALGYVWSLLRPLFLFIILYVVFNNFLKIGSTIPHYPVYLLLGIVLWNYFLEVTNLGISSIVSKGDLIRKLNFPQYVIVLAGSFSAFINLLINFVVIAVFMVIGGVEISWSALLVFPLMAELFLLSLGVAFFLSALFVKLRDLNYIWEIFLQAAFYATPILYPLSLVMEKSDFAAKLLLLNPVAQIIQDARSVLVTTQTSTFETVFRSGGWYRWLPIILTLAAVVIAAWYFRRRSPKFAEEV
jgi:ABC-2 type transport system permease protein